jgi:Tfp pilus assembly protein FimT
MKLLETVMVISIALVVMILVYLPFATYRKSQALSGATENILSLLSQARTDTVSSVNNNQYGLHLASTTLTLFAGSAYPGTTVQTITLPSAVIISDTSLVGNGVNVVFERVTGTTDEYGTITLQQTDDATKQRIIKVEATGLSYVQ